MKFKAENAAHAVVTYQSPECIPSAPPMPSMNDPKIQNDDANIEFIDEKKSINE